MPGHLVQKFKYIHGVLLTEWIGSVSNTKGQYSNHPILDAKGYPSANGYLTNYVKHGQGLR